eukprot:PhM_4_TR3829/c0_g1_i2/m.43859
MVGVRGRQTRRAKKLHNVRLKARKSNQQLLLKKKNNLAKSNALAKELLVESTMKDTIDRSYAKVGVASKVNIDLKHKPTKMTAQELSDLKPADGETLIPVPEAAEPVGLKYFSSGECVWLSQLVAAHGNNYRKMFFDLKLNPYQLTETQLRKKVEAYQKIIAAAAQEQQE